MGVIHTVLSIGIGVVAALLVQNMYFSKQVVNGVYEHKIVINKVGTLLTHSRKQQKKSKRKRSLE